MSTTPPHNTIPLFLLALLLTARSTKAQSSPSNQSSDTLNNLNSTPHTSKSQPTTAIIAATIISVVILICLFFYSWIFYNDVPNLFDTAAATSNRYGGLDRAVLDSFPTMTYSDVKDHKIGKTALECAVCLNEFEDEDSLRLLPKCSHVFHEECIDAWLASHVTCPVCRAVLEKEEARETVEIEEQVVVAVEDEEEKRKERRELARIASRTWRGVVRKQRRLSRAVTTGHIADAEDLERYTLRLPEDVRNGIIVASKLQRERSLPVRGARGGEEGGSSGRQSFWVGSLAKLPSFFVRSRSANSSELGWSPRGQSTGVK